MEQTLGSVIVCKVTSQQRQPAAVLHYYCAGTTFTASVLAKFVLHIHSYTEVDTYLILNSLYSTTRVEL